METLSGDHPIESLRSRDRRADPDLLVRRLLVEDIGALVRNGDFENAGLEMISSRRLYTLGFAISATY